jgi:xanthine dehydrogenase small subunit
MEPLRYVTEDATYTRPASLSECLEELATDHDACLVAGNTDCGVRANLVGERRTARIDVRRLPELRRFAVSDDAVEIGAALSITEIDELWKGQPAAFAECRRQFGSPQIRNRATLGGNLATASPVGDFAPLLLILDAEIVIASLAGSRFVPVADFVLGTRRSVLSHGDVVMAIRIPAPLPEITCFQKISKRSCNDIATVSAALSLRRDAQRRIIHARIAYGGVAPTPVRIRDAEDALVGTCGLEEDFDRAGRIVASTLRPINDVRGSASYRTAVARNLLTRFWMDLEKS